MTSVLVIDDDRKLCALLSEYLSRFDFAVRTATTPGAGLEEIGRELPDIIILDVMLPGTDGFTLCREIRKSHSVPIIMLTARGELSDRVVGLEMGADDYLPKPFEPRELVARMQSVLRRSRNDAPGRVFRAGDLEMDFDRRHITVKGDEVVLTSMEFTLLSLLRATAAWCSRANQLRAPQGPRRESSTAHRQQ